MSSQVQKVLVLVFQYGIYKGYYEWLDQIFFQEIIQRYFLKFYHI